jgi:hypothetical protein
VGDTLAEVSAQLYAVPPEEFVTARAQAVTQARAAGDRALADAIGKLRKPTVGAWLVNLLAHQRPDLVADLLALGDEMRRAQRELRGADLRELSQRRRETVSGLARQARALAVQAGRGVRDQLPLDEVEGTLVAALADSDVAEEVRAGRLAKTVAYAGFGEPPRPQLRLVKGGAGTKAKVEPKAKEKPEAEQREAEEREAEDRRRAEREAAERAAAERAEAARRRKARADAHRELMSARTELAEAESARAEAERAVVAARRRVEKALAKAAALDDGG